MMINFLKNKIRNFIYNSRSNIKTGISIKSLIDRNDLTYYLKSFGKLNKKKIFYVIQRYKGGGIFSNLNYVIHHLKIANDLGCIPIIDMKNFPTKYNEINKIKNTFNSWEYFFYPINRWKLEDIYKSKFVIIADGKTKKKKEFDSFKNLSKAHYDIYKNHIKIKKFILNLVKKFEEKNFYGNKVLGVHFRGTDMKTQERHPFPATLEQIITAVKYQVKKYNYNKIFLVTEENEYLFKLNRIFRDKICFTNSFRTSKHNIFEQEYRKNHRFNLGVEHIVDMLLLAKTSSVICTNSHLSDACKFINNDKKFKLIQIDNGNNSSNILVAQFLWYLKKNLPCSFGGFK